MIIATKTTLSLTPFQAVKRNFICIEKDKDYYNLSVERLKRERIKRSLI